MTCQILFDNGCGTSICARYSDVLGCVYTTTSILQKYLDDHRGVKWMDRFRGAREFARAIAGAESRLVVVDGKWNEGGWQEPKDFFDGTIVRDIPCVNINWNWR